MKIKWYGHSCFLIEYNNFRIVTDPFDKCLNYTLPELKPDLITVSHYHEDHFCPSFSENIPVLDFSTDNFCYKDIQIKGIKSFHDEKKGTLRGENIIFSFDFGKINLIHLGDIGDTNFLPEKYFSKNDVLLAPFGGIYTIDGNAAKIIAEKLNTKILIPMHYKTEKIEFELNELEHYNFNYIEKDFLEINNNQELPAELEIFKLRIAEKRG